MLKISNPSHHAHLIVANNTFWPQLEVDLIKYIEKEYDIEVTGNSDFAIRKYATLTISDSRSLKEQAETRPTTITGRRFFVLFIENIAVEAQNALLKLLEEPAEYAFFYFVIPSSHILLNTVRSRMTTDQYQGFRTAAASETAKFISLPKTKRLEIIKNLLDDISKEKMTKQDAVNFLNSIEREVHSERNLKNNMQILENIDLARKYIYDRAPSVKMLLEFVALN